MPRDGSRWPSTRRGDGRSRPTAKERERERERESPSALVRFSRSFVIAQRGGGRTALIHPSLAFLWRSRGQRVKFNSRCYSDTWLPLHALPSVLHPRVTASLLRRRRWHSFCDAFHRPFGESLDPISIFSFENKREEASCRDIPRKCQLFKTFSFNDGVWRKFTKVSFCCWVDGEKSNCVLFSNRWTCV